MCQRPAAPFRKWWIWRSRIGSKSDCILRPATSTQIPSGRAVPSSTASMSEPISSIAASSISSSSTEVTNSKAEVLLPPNSACTSALRMRSPSKAGPKDTGTGTSETRTLQPRTSSAFSTIVSTGTFDTTCS